MPANFEEEVQRIAQEIAAAGAGEKTKVFKMSWASQKMLEFAMARPAFKTQLFRFVDVFPACRNDADIVRHLDEYFEGDDIPAVLNFGLDTASRVPFGRKLTGKVARSNITRMARQFIAGASASQALPALEKLWRAGEASTVDLLGERTVTQAEAGNYAARVAEMIEALSAVTWSDNPILTRDPWGEIPRVNVSVKPTALTPLFTPSTATEGIAEAFARLEPTLQRANELGATVHLDTESYDAKDLTLALVRKIGAAFPKGPQLGVVVQAYLKDSHDDLESLIAWSAGNLAKPLQVRLVKGAYWDYETIHAEAEGWPIPVYEDKSQTDANYERCVSTMLDGAGKIRPAFASHNIRSLAFAIAATHARGLPDDAIELQLLYGMAEPIHAALRHFGLRVRVYAPVGELVPGMAYLVRRLLENTSNESFVRQRFAENQDIAELIAPPDVDELPEIDEIHVALPATDSRAPGTFRNEPVTEFRRARHQTRMSSAISEASDRFGFRAPVVIDGRHHISSETIDSFDPAHTSTLICRSSRATIQQADDAVSVALRAFPKWRATPAYERAEIIFNAAAIMRGRRLELASLIVFEAGKPWHEADADVAEAIDFCEYYGREAVRLAAGKPMIQAAGETNSYRYQPRGVGAVITPWNFPLAIPTSMVVAPLVAGNCVVFKPAEQTPGIAFRLAEILYESGVPQGVLSFLPGVGEEVGAHLVDHTAIAFVSFTGSKAVGLGIVASAAVDRPGQNHVKRVVAEMGGKNAIIVDSDADLDQAVPAIVTSSFGYAGQKCSAASRIICVGHPGLLIERLKGATAVVPIGHPREHRTLTGPLIDSDALRRVQNYQEIARKEGEILIQREDLPPGGYFAGPTIALTTEPRCRTATEEIFGPLAVLIAAGDFDQALAIANDTPYALTGGIFSRSPSRIKHAAENFRAGNLYINRPITGALVGRQPFGGYGLSGVGAKAGGPDYLLQFTEPRVVTENTIRQGFAPPNE